MVERRGFAWAALLAYVALVGLITLWPSAVDAPLNYALIELLDTLHRHGLPYAIDYNLIEFVANIVMFIPLGLFLTLAFPPGARLLAPFLTVGLSLFVEASQYLFRPERFADVSDLVANSLGGFVGAALAGILILRHRRRARLARPAPRRESLRERELVG